MRLSQCILSLFDERLVFVQSQHRVIDGAVATRCVDEVTGTDRIRKFTVPVWVCRTLIKAR